MDEREPQAEPSLSKVYERVRRDVEARRAGFTEGAEPRVGVPEPHEQIFSLPRASNRAAPVPIRDEYALDELLVYNDEDFVRNAYRAILRREPDPEGLINSLASLYGGGLSKFEILGWLQSSEEARRYNVRVRGLPFVLRVRRWLHTPVIGPIVGIALYLVRLPSIVRAFERHQVLVWRRDRELGAAIDAVASSSENAVNALSSQTTATFRSVGDALHELDDRKASRGMDLSITGKMAALRLDMAQIGTEVSRIEHALEDKAARAEFDRIRAGFDALRTELREIDRALAAEGMARTHGGESRLDRLYVDFEDRFRGAPEDIRQRMSVYVPLMQAVGAGAPDAPVLDIGCGRGEWLELLREQGIAARGIDLNTIMVEHCRAMGLDVAEDEALRCLSQLPEARLGAITGFHIIEHMRFRQRIELIDAALRVLRPGGALVLETPNPENVSVGSCAFWNDPTHIQPLPPEPTRFIVQARGFARVEIVRLHPYPAEAHLPAGDVVRDTINHILFGPQDYAIVAYKEST